MTNYECAHDVLCTSIKPSIFLLLLQYFYGQYCYETRIRLASFDAEFKEDIDKQRKKLKKVKYVIVCQLPVGVHAPAILPDSHIGNCAYLEVS